MKRYVVQATDQDTLNSFAALPEKCVAVYRAECPFRTFVVGICGELGEYGAPTVSISSFLLTVYIQLNRITSSDVGSIAKK